MMKMQAIVVYAILLLYIGCALPEEEPVYILQGIEIIQEELQMNLKPLPEYGNYYHTGNKIFGMDDAGLHPIVVTDTDDKHITPDLFAAIDGDIFLSVKTYEQGDPVPDTDPVQYEAVEVMHYFKQSGDVIESIIELPIIPSATTIELDSTPYKIVSDDYKGTAISSVFQGDLKMNHMPVDGCVVNNMGLFFHVTLPSGTPAGLWCWPANGNPKRVTEPGRLW